MTLEELKAEAKRQGYNLVPKPKPKEKLMACPVCGCKQRHSQWGLAVIFVREIDQNDDNHDEYFRLVECQKCGLQGPKIPGTKEQDTIRAWNEYITKGETYWNEHPEQKPELYFGR